MWDWNHCVTLIRPLCYSETLTLTGQEFLEGGVRKDWKHWARGPGYRVDIKHLPAELLRKMCWPSSHVRPSVIVQQDNTGTKHPAPLVLHKFHHSPHFTVGEGWYKSLCLHRCNNVTARTLEISLVHASCDVITLSRKHSRFTKKTVY